MSQNQGAGQNIQGANPIEKRCRNESLKLSFVGVSRFLHDFYLKDDFVFKDSGNGKKLVSV